MAEGRIEGFLHRRQSPHAYQRGSGATLSGSVVNNPVKTPVAHDAQSGFFVSLKPAAHCAAGFSVQFGSHALKEAGGFSTMMV